MFGSTLVASGLLNNGVPYPTFSIRREENTVAAIRNKGHYSANPRDKKIRDKSYDNSKIDVGSCLFVRASTSRAFW